MILLLRKVTNFKLVFQLEILRQSAALWTRRRRIWSLCFCAMEKCLDCKLLNVTSSLFKSFKTKKKGEWRHVAKWFRKNVEWVQRITNWISSKQTVDSYSPLRRTFQTKFFTSSQLIQLQSSKLEIWNALESVVIPHAIQPLLEEGLLIIVIQSLPMGLPHVNRKLDELTPVSQTIWLSH